jgi:hypothetical protein
LLTDAGEGTEKEAAMGAVSRACRVAAAGGGFLAGYLWSVVNWARAAGMAAGPAERGTFVAGGLFLAALYAVLLGTLWGPPETARAPGLRIVVAPAAFTLSFLAGALGIRLALGLVG